MARLKSHWASELASPKVWLVETEIDRETSFRYVARSIRSGVQAVQKEWGEKGYIVDWTEETNEDGSLILVGHFAYIPGFCTEHVQYTTFTEMDVV